MIVKNKILNTLFGKEFEFIDSGFCDGQYNMDFDYNRMIDCSKYEALPMFRVYGWNPWTVSLGANQKSSDILVSECSKHNFGIVRRPTGGRAVLHANEITYSVVLPLPERFSVHDAYREIHIILLEALKSTGATGIDFQKSQPDLLNFYKTSTMSVSCFASSARYEIELQGRKVVGSAQRLFDNVLLQHGSILLGSGHEMLAQVVKANSDEDRKKLEDFILSHSATIDEAAGRNITYEQCAEAIFKALTRVE